MGRTKDLFMDMREQERIAKEKQYIINQQKQLKWEQVTQKKRISNFTTLRQK